MQIREYRPADFEGLWHLDQECFAPGIAYSRFDLMEFIRQPRAFTLVAQDDGGPICGFCVGQSAPPLWRSDTLPRPKTGHVITIDVRRQARSRGVGTVLMDSLEGRLSKSGCSSVYLEVAVDNPSALRFYTKRGYTVVRVLPRYYPGGLDGLKMGKKLRSGRVAL